MCILGAVLTDKVMVDPLTDYIWIGPGKHGTKQLKTVSRLFIALAEGLRSLDEFYRNVNLDSQGCPTDCFFPDMQSYPGPSGHVPIKYLAPLVPKQRSKTIFKAEISGQTVVVKFTDRYNAAAHKLLAEANLAPQLQWPRGSEFKSTDDGRDGVFGGRDGRRVLHRNLRRPSEMSRQWITPEDIT
jgi:hypothetical protein